MNYRGYELNQTSGACPEAYDVVSEEDDEVVAKLRLRFGHFTADIHGLVVYEAYVDGDGLFAPGERDTQLKAALDAVYKALNPEDVDDLKRRCQRLINEDGDHEDIDIVARALLERL